MIQIFTIKYSKFIVLPHMKSKKNCYIKVCYNFIINVLEFHSIIFVSVIEIISDEIKLLLYIIIYL
jgi:hypothetical protein